MRAGGINEMTPLPNTKMRPVSVSPVCPATTTPKIPTPTASPIAISVRVTRWRGCITGEVPNRRRMTDPAAAATAFPAIADLKVKDYSVFDHETVIIQHPAAIGRRDFAVGEFAQKPGAVGADPRLGSFLALNAGDRKQSRNQYADEAACKGD